MKHLNKPNLNVADIVADCANSYTDFRKKARFISQINYIKNEGDNYDTLGQCGELYTISPTANVNGVISTQEMIDAYNNKFVADKSIRIKYYDKIITSATTGKCPICGISSVSNLDHYLAKTLYPTFALTPANLVPMCSFCNHEKRVAVCTNAINASLHPYYDDIDNIIWLKAQLEICKDSFTVAYEVNGELQLSNKLLYDRLVNHCKLYKLFDAFSVQAGTEIAENQKLWRNILMCGGENAFKQFLEASIDSKEQVQKNTWKTALLRAILKNPTIVL